MTWQLVVGFNLVIAACYAVIFSLILGGLVRSRQLTSNALALATSAIFLTCSLHHLEHGLHVLGAMTGDQAATQEFRAVFTSWHQVLIELAGAAAAVVYLGMRRSYKTLLNTPSMFEDAVRAEASERLREMAYTDLLTGVPNRAAFRVLADELAGDEHPVSVLFIDVDGFKEVNDLHGHEAGDRLLAELGQRLLRGLAGSEQLFRTGGDEFVLVAPRTDAAAADAVAQRLHEVVAEPAGRGPAGTAVTASIGVATGRGHDGLDRLLRDADADMYRAKARRRPAAEGHPG